MNAIECKCTVQCSSLSGAKMLALLSFLPNLLLVPLPISARP